MDREYEFGTEDNDIISGVASNMGFVGTALIVLGTLIVLGALAALYSHVGRHDLLISGVILIILGVLTLNVARSMRSIVETEGNDIALLRVAMANLSRLYAIQKWILIISIALVFLVLLVTLGILGVAISGFERSL